MISLNITGLAQLSPWVFSYKVLMVIQVLSLGLSHLYKTYSETMIVTKSDDFEVNMEVFDLGHALYMTF